MCKIAFESRENLEEISLTNRKIANDETIHLEKQELLQMGVEKIEENWNRQTWKI